MLSVILNLTSMFVVRHSDAGLASDEAFHVLHFFHTVREVLHAATIAGGESFPLSGALASAIVILFGADVYRMGKSALAKAGASAVGIGASKRAKAGIYKSTHSRRNRMVVPSRRSEPVVLSLDGEGYELEMTAATDDEREAQFDCRCARLGHVVGRANWRPWWEGNPNELLLTVHFEKGKGRLQQVFHRTPEV
jgi:hypothetical protein